MPLRSPPYDAKGLAVVMLDLLYALLVVVGPLALLGQELENHEALSLELRKVVRLRLGNIMAVRSYLLLQPEL